MFAVSTKLKTRYITWDIHFSFIGHALIFRGHSILVPGLQATNTDRTIVLNWLKYTFS